MSALKIVANAASVLMTAGNAVSAMRIVVIRRNLSKSEGDQSRWCLIEWRGQCGASRTPGAVGNGGSWACDQSSIR